MISRVENISNCIFNLHAPPYDSTLDIAPLLDEDLRPVVSCGDLLKVPVGSKAVRESIEKWQPLLGLHGHIHESASQTKLGRTLCVNPGSEYHEGILRGYLIDIDNKEVKRYLRVEG
jgi:Icc-related predicted phosphoesterase